MAQQVRTIVLALVLIVGTIVVVLVNRRTAPGAGATLLTYVATAHQLGVVGYRDPVGVISPDGSRIAYAEGAHVRVAAIGGGPMAPLPAADGQVRHLAWGAGGPGALVAEDTGATVRWWLLDPGSGSRRPLFGDRDGFEAVDANGGATVAVRANALRNVVTSPDHLSIAASAVGANGAELWRIALDGSSAEVRRVDGRLSAPAWTPDGSIVCVVTRDDRARITTPCGGAAMTLSPDVDVVGPLAFSPDGATVYFASPNARGTVDLWSADWSGGRARRLTSFDRDTYAPSVAADGTLLFKTQSYRTNVAEIDLPSGQLRQLATFQSETPSYDPTGSRVAVTFGTWRRAIDDANYPDIAQEIGLVAAGPDAGPAAEPIDVIADSKSEDQAMSWSPNGRWIAFHSHREMSDDVWLRPSDGSAPDRRITFLGRGAEVGWPRWSPDGRSVLFDGASPTTGRSVTFVIGVDQDSGTVTSDAREVAVTGIDGETTHAEWLGGSDTIIAIAREAPGRHVIFTAPVSGGAAQLVRRFASDHDFPGLAASPDGREVAFIERAADGHYQVFRMAVADWASPVQVTIDPTDKTQPAWSPDGLRIAFTVWSYQAQFWTIRP